MKYLTEITRTIETFITFKSTDAIYKTELESYQIPYTLHAGKRQHTTTKAAIKHIETINKEFGAGTAIYIGAI